MAGTLVELKQAVKRDYPSLNWREMQIVLAQSGENLLVDLPDRLGRYTTRKLRQLGVKVHFQTRVRRVMEQVVEFSDGSTLPAGTVVWATG